jgi:hypothetical protein
MSLLSSPAILWSAGVLFLTAGRLGLGTGGLDWPQPSRFFFWCALLNSCSSTLARARPSSAVTTRGLSALSVGRGRHAALPASRCPRRPARLGGFRAGPRLPRRHVVPLGRALCPLPWAVPPSSCPRYRCALLPPLPCSVSGRHRRHA